MPRLLVLAATTLLAAAAPSAQVLAADAAPVAEAAWLVPPAGDLLVMAGAGLAASGGLVALAFATDTGVLLILTPVAAAAAVFATGEARGNDGSLIMTTVSAGVGSLVGLTAAAAASGELAEGVFLALGPAVGAVLGFPVGAPTLFRTPLGEAVPGWSVRLGL